MADIAESTNALAAVTVYTPINQISPIASNITVSVLGGRQIYNIETDVPIGLFDCDLTGLDLDGAKVARWEVWINYTHSNALETTWADTIEWKRWEPELTVTGRYKFAFSAVSNNKIDAEQLYPTQTIWSNLEREEARGGSYAEYQGRFECETGTTNYLFSNLSAVRGIFATDPDATELILIKPQFRGYSGANTFVYGVASSTASYYTGTPEAQGVIWRDGGRINHSQTIRYPIIGFELGETDRYLHVWIGHISGTGRIFLQPGSFWIRKANELEKKAWFNDGWRP